MMQVASSASTGVNRVLQGNYISKSSEFVTRLRAGCRACGFTLIELLVTLVVIAILTMIAVPSMKHALVSTHLAGINNDLAGDLHFARTTAVSRRIRVAVAASAGNWQNGWTVNIPSSSTATPPLAPEILRVHPAVRDQYVVTAGTATEVIYQPQGSLALPSGVTELCFTIYSPTAPGNTPRFLKITSPGGLQQQTAPSGTLPGCTAPSP